MRRGHEVRLITPPPQDQPGGINLLGCDATVISNFATFPQQMVQVIAERNKTIFYLHDYWGACHFRLFYPLAERCLTKCPVSPFTQLVMNKAALLVWLSPLHRAAWLKKHPELECVPYHLHPSPIDLAPFEAMAKSPGRVKGTVIGSNALAGYKGGNNCLDYAKDHPELKFTFIGGPEEGTKLPDNCEVIERVPHAKMPAVLSRFEYGILLPGSPQPYERFPVEARASGCRLLLNELVGCTSYPHWPDWEATKKATQESPGKFWDRVEAVV